MGNERYQLVAIDNVTKEKYVIQLKNDNKINKGALGFIDRGTSKFKDMLQLARYLHSKGKIPTLNVQFTIVYLQNKEEKNLPVIFNDSSIYNVSKMVDNTIDWDNDFVYYVVRLLLAKLNYKEFYDYIIRENNHNYRLKNCGNYLNSRILGIIINYHDNYVKPKNMDVNTASVQYGLLKELSQYKQLRTLYYLMKKYDLQRSVEPEEVEELTFDDIHYDEVSPMRQIKPEMQEEVEQLVRIGGMDEVYSYYDGDQVFDVGCLSYKK